MPCCPTCILHDSSHQSLPRLFVGNPNASLCLPFWTAMDQHLQMLSVRQHIRQLSRTIGDMKRRVTPDQMLELSHAQKPSDHGTSGDHVFFCVVLATTPCVCCVSDISHDPFCHSVHRRIFVRVLHSDVCVHEEEEGIHLTGNTRRGRLGEQVD